MSARCRIDVRFVRFILALIKSMKYFIDIAKTLKNYVTTERFTADVDGNSYPLQDVLHAAFRAASFYSFPDEFAADDAISEVTDYVLARCHEFDPSRANLKTFGSKLGRYATLHFLEKEYRRRGKNVSLESVMDRTDGYTPEDECGRNESYARIERAWSRVSPESQRVLELLADGKKGKTLAAELGCNANCASMKASEVRDEFYAELWVEQVA